MSNVCGHVLLTSQLDYVSAESNPDSLYFVYMTAETSSLHQKTHHKIQQLSFIGL